MRFDLKILIIRHAKVNHVWKKWCTSSEFDEQCSMYDTASVDTSPLNPLMCDVSDIYISKLIRTYYTARKMFGDKIFTRTSLINEVPMCAGIKTSLKMPLWFWYMVARIQWITGSSRQPETMDKTRRRARIFVKKILDKNTSCGVVTHGFFMRTLIKALKEQGFTSDVNPLYFHNGEVITLYRNE